MTNTTAGDGDADRSAPAAGSPHTDQSHRNDSDGPKSAEPWYSEGLQFTCSQCGDCCTGAPGAVWVTEDELSAIAAELGKPVGEVRLLHTKLIAGRWSLRDYPNGDCVFLDPQTRRCQVYHSRPIQCRTWPFWPSNISTPASWKRTCEICPGSGTGQLHSLSVIQSQAAACDI